MLMRSLAACGRGRRSRPACVAGPWARKTFHLLSATFSVLADGNHLRALLFSALIIFPGNQSSPADHRLARRTTSASPCRIPYRSRSWSAHATFISARLIGHWADKHGKVEVYRQVALLAMIPTLVLTHISAAAVGLADCFRQLFRVHLGPDDPGHGDHRPSAQPGCGTFMSLNGTVQSSAMGLATTLGPLDLD